MEESTIIKRAYINIRPNGRTLLAHVTAWFEMGLVVRDIQLHKKGDKYFLQWPQMINMKQERYDSVYPENKELISKLTNEIVTRYETLVSVEINDESEMESGNNDKRKPEEYRL